MMRAKLVGGICDGQTMTLREEVVWLDVQGHTYVFSRLLRDDMLEYIAFNEPPEKKKDDRNTVPEIGEDAPLV